MKKLSSILLGLSLLFSTMPLKANSVADDTYKILGSLFITYMLRESLCSFWEAEIKKDKKKMYLINGVTLALLIPSALVFKRCFIDGIEKEKRTACKN